MKHEHNYVLTGYIQTTYWGGDKNEREEWQCENCHRAKWLALGMTPRIARASLKKVKDGLNSQLQLKLL